MRMHKTEPAMPDVDMTPMIDVVFQLIAFFMVIINFEATQADERVKLPNSDIARPHDFKPKDELVLNVGFLRDKDGNLMDQQPYVFYPGELILIPDMKSRLQLESEFFTVGKAVDAEGNLTATVTIRADADVPAGLIQQLIKLCRQAKFEKFTLKVKAEEP